MKFSTTQLFNLGNGTYSLGEGLIFRVTPTDRSFFVRYQVNGKRTMRLLGKIETMNLREARSACAKFRDAVKENGGIETKSSNVKFKDFYLGAIQSIDSVRQWKNEKHREQWFSTIQMYALPVIGDKFITNITKEDILDILNPIWFPKSETANRLMGRLRAIFAIAKSQGLIIVNPVDWKEHLSFVLPSRAKATPIVHHAAMPFEELQDFVAKLAKSSRLGSKLTLFGILTCVRVQEFVTARWEDIDFETNVWTIPEKFMKMKIEHKVPLSRQAIEILNSIGECSSKTGFVFKGRNGSCYNKEAPRKKIRDLTKKPYTMHGMRSTFRDWCASQMVPEALAEKALSHSYGDKVVKAYFRTDLLEQRVPLMQEWADAIFAKVDS